ncbi:MAG: Fic family protein [Selenomonadaceae bacterium]|nr:Fic family protein [Selenomonadaceae bacterium]
MDENVNRDVSDVINYIKATEYALQRLQEMPLCNRLIREIHKVLLSDTRGAEKNPGEFRYSKNWIGGQGSTLRTARYIPPNPENMHEAISQLEKYIHAEDSLNPLIQAALIHYQFETIHPFLDGNGRIGRLLITLFLMEKNVLSTPALYISYYLKLNRVEYYDRMTEVRRTGDYEQWIFFFLQAFTDSARDAITAIDQLTALHQESVNTINSFTQRQQKNLLKLLSYLEAHPIIDISQTADALDLSYNTVAKSITTLMDKGLLQQTAKNGKARIFSYTKYLEILRKDT